MMVIVEEMDLSYLRYIVHVQLSIVDWYDNGTESV